MIRSISLEESQVIAVGMFGKSVGLKGGVRFFTLTDFPEILQKNAKFYIEHHSNLDSLGNIFDLSSVNKEYCKELDNSLQYSFYFPITLHSFNTMTKVIHFEEFSSRLHADFLRNLTLYSTIEDTRKLCFLDKDEFFYFDVIGMSVIEEGEILGIVKDIQEIANTYYFILESNFMIPYIDRYVLSIDLPNKKIFTNDARFLKVSP